MFVCLFVCFGRSALITHAYCNYCLSSTLSTQQLPEHNVLDSCSIPATPAFLNLLLYSILTAVPPNTLCRAIPLSVSSEWALHSWTVYSTSPHGSVPLSPHRQQRLNVSTHIDISAQFTPVTRLFCCCVAVTVLDAFLKMQHWKGCLEGLR